MIDRFALQGKAEISQALIANLQYYSEKILSMEDQSKQVFKNANLSCTSGDVNVFFE